MAINTYKAAPLLISLLALGGCPGDDVPADTEGTSTGGEDDSTTVPVTVSTTTPTTTVDPDSGSGDGSSSSDGGVMCEPACAAGECCVVGSCFGPPDPACAGGCPDGEECVSVDGSDPCDGEGMCVAGECGVDGGYDPCFDTQCPAGYICLVDNVANPTVSWCALEGCGDACDCPTPPDGFDAGCSDITGSGTNHCALDCTGGAPCPDGMACFANFCVWPAEAGGEGIYGDCVNGGSCDLGMGLTCLSDMEATFGWCSLIDCVDDMDCEPAPATGDAPPVCAPILNMGMTNACILDCSMGQTCPDSMSCFMDSFCVWTEDMEGYGNCGLPAVDCPAGEVCLDDNPMGMNDPVWSVCSQDVCTDAADCTFIPPGTGNAPVACADPTGMGGASTCYLDCSMGETCPDGMACIDSSWCAWPQGPMLFEDDFETGDFMAGGWTLNDVDMQVPEMPVNFVTDAWVVSDMVDGGAGSNLAATSTSWYNPVGMSDDWLISPQIMVGANARVYWQARSSDPAFPDGYELRISTATPDPADFTANAELFSVAAEDDAYSLRFVDLAAAGYSNQQVYLAWRNVTDNGNLLAVDNVAVVDLP